LNTRIIRADQGHVARLLPLFNGYRTFYEQSPDEAGARLYLTARMNNDDAVIFLVEVSGSPTGDAGFVLLYPTFDSVELASIWVLHDLFVNPEYRQRGIGRLLMNSARDFCQNTDAARIDLGTAITNTIGQTLYESLGYERDNEFYRYSLDL
jgi:ribosomal protein S18 acetylase RimI-like enzyme